MCALTCIFRHSVISVTPPISINVRYTFSADCAREPKTPVQTSGSPKFRTTVAAFTITLARDKKIEVKADANISCVLGISELELCSIIGNLFDNAIEASENLPEDMRVIRVYIDLKGNQLYISFLNFTSGGKLKKMGNIFKSTKGGEHGFGLGRIDDVVKRLGGYVSRNSEEGAFTTEVLLPMSENR